MIIGRVRPNVDGSSHLQRARACARASWLLHTIAALAIAVAGGGNLGACGLSPIPEGAESLGFANRGSLVRAVELPVKGPGFQRARVGDGAGFGTARLVGLLARSAAEVARAYPGTAPLYIGDLSDRFGGKHSRHGSHRTGRDVDVLFYLTDAQGRSVRGSGFYAFDERGVGYVREASAPVRGLAFFDAQRNWAFVRSLLLDAEAPVQWIFCANGIKARLLAHARQHEPNTRLLYQASQVLHEPSKGNPHRDHFHIRIACTGEERAHGCQDAGPIWPWLRNQHEKAEIEGPGHDDDALVRALLDDTSGGMQLVQK